MLDPSGWSRAVLTTLCPVARRPDDQVDRTDNRLPRRAGYPIQSLNTQGRPTQKLVLCRRDASTTESWLPSIVAVAPHCLKA